ncbi:response regulator, partial [Streptomyces sp. NPDC002920]
GLIASYGHPVAPGEAVRFRLGQSLVGQAARSRRIIAVDDLPAGYVTISSGLGSASPSSLIVLPIVVEDQVLGVIELASVASFTPVHRDFLGQLMETVGVNVNTIVANGRTDELLGESQRLAAELQARSEELQVQQEELQRSNAELEEKAVLLVSQNSDIETKNLEIEQARQELEERAHQLTLASKYKSEFLANMSHELRTPLNSLLILAQLLAQNPGRNLTSKQVEYAGVIHSAGSDLLQLIDDILDLSKVEAGKMNIAPERLPLNRLLEYVDATFRPLTGQKGLDFQVTVDPGVPAELVTDDSRLRQILRNLLSNAVKFTETGRVELRIVAASESGLPATVRSHGPLISFQILDTGIGIAEHQLETIFGAFQQADGTTSRKYGGTGLGLSISREIAHLLGGAITATSVPGEGSVFTLHLPVAWFEPADAETADEAPENSAAPESEVRGPVGPRRLLVVEDQPRGLLSLVAESTVNGHEDTGLVQVRSATTPEDAAAALAADAFLCVVLDLDMADGAAVSVLAALDGNPALRQIPVLAHHSRERDPDRLLRNTSPTNPPELLTGLDELRERIAVHLAAERPADVLPPGTGRPVSKVLREVPGAAGELAGRTVLVIDDDARNVYALASMLELHAVRVLHADNGRTGMETLALNRDVELIIMDVMMPEMDGYAATSAIRAMPEYAELPIIAVTAKAMEGDREKSLAAGASDYITKPVDMDALVACMLRWLRR